MVAVPPTISIVTPSFNQAAFLRAALTSVLGQQWPRLEYIVMDGGSADTSAEVIREFAPLLAFWQSQPDGGQAAAINAGFAKCAGGILGWLNSDDMYLPDILGHVADRLDPARPQILIGNCVSLNEKTGRVSLSSVPARHAAGDIRHCDYIIQPSAFWTRRAWEAAGPLDQSLHYAFDWDWFIRAKAKGVEFLTTDRCLSVYRIHEDHKSSGGGAKRAGELAAIYGRHLGPRFESLFLACVQAKPKIEKARRLARRWRLGRHENIFLALACPGLLKGFSEAEIKGVLAMI